MSAVGNEYSAEYIAQLEQQIFSSVVAKQQEVFGDNPVEILEGDPRQALVNEYLNELVKDFPCSDRGNRFIQTSFQVCPTIAVNWKDLKPIYEQDGDSLFLTQIALGMKISAITKSAFGVLIKEDQFLKLENIFFPQEADLKPNELTLEKVKEDLPKPGATYLNKPTTQGEFNLDPNLRKTKIVADIQFGELLKQDGFEIEVETNADHDFMTLLIPLPSLRGRVKWDGTVTLPNGHHFSLSDAGIVYNNSLVIGPTLNVNLRINLDD